MEVCEVQITISQNSTANTSEIQYEVDLRFESAPEILKKTEFHKIGDSKLQVTSLNDILSTVTTMTKEGVDAVRRISVYR